MGAFSVLGFLLSLLLKVLFILWIYLPFGHTQTTDPVFLQKGGTQRIGLPSVSSHIYIEKRILTAKIDQKKTELVLTATQLGQTLVRIDSKTLSVLVLSYDDLELIRKFKKHWLTHPSLEVSYDLQGLFIEGEILSAHDLETIFKFKEHFKESLRLKVHFHSFLKSELQSWLSQYFQERVSINNNKLESLTFSAAPGKKILNKLKKLELKHQYESVSLSPIGRLKINFAEIKKSHLQKLSPILLNTHSLSALSLKALLNDEYSHIDDQIFTNVGSQTEMILFDQQLAKVHSGGEFPVLNQSFRRSDVTWKQYGLFINVTGHDQHDSSILSLDFRLSMVNNMGSEGPPSLSTDSWTQKIRVLKDHTYILKSGLARNYMTTKGQSFLAKHIPLFKFLFHSQSKNKGDTEVVLVLSLSTIKEN